MTACKRVKYKFNNGITPSIINNIILKVNMINNEDLVKSYSVRNGTLYLTLTYNSEKCDEIYHVMKNEFKGISHEI